MRVFSRHDLDLIKTVQAHLLKASLLCQAMELMTTTQIATATLTLSEDMLQRAWYASGLPRSVTFKTYFIANAGNDAIAYCGGGDILPMFLSRYAQC